MKLPQAKRVEDAEGAQHLWGGGGGSDVFHDADVGGWRANLVERGSQTKSELVMDLTGDLAVTTAWNALTHVSTSRRDSAIFVSRDAHANTGFSDVTHTHTHFRWWLKKHAILWKGKGMQRMNKNRQNNWTINIATCLAMLCIERLRVYIYVAYAPPSERNQIKLLC